MVRYQQAKIWFLHLPDFLECGESCVIAECNKAVYGGDNTKPKFYKKKYIYFSPVFIAPVIQN
jgi:ribosomal protein L13